jgi:hypothetical protein
MLLRSTAIAFAFWCACTIAAMPLVGQPARDSPYLLLFAGDQDKADSDFLAVIDLRPDSATFGKAIATQPIGMTESMPHHMEYQLPPDGELLFMNAHHHEMSFLVDVSNPRAPRIAKTFSPPAPLRFPHDYSRTPSGHASRGLPAQRRTESGSGRSAASRQSRRHRRVQRRRRFAANSVCRNPGRE